MTKALLKFNLNDSGEEHKLRRIFHCDDCYGILHDLREALIFDRKENGTPKEILSEGLDRIEIEELYT